MYREAIISWVEEKLIPAVTELSTVPDADIVLESRKTIAVALFDKLEVSLIYTSETLLQSYLCCEWKMYLWFGYVFH